MTRSGTLTVGPRTRGAWRLTVARWAVRTPWREQVVLWALERLAVEVVAGGTVLETLRPSWVIHPDGTIDVSMPSPTR